MISIEPICSSSARMISASPRRSLLATLFLLLAMAGGSFRVSLAASTEEVKWKKAAGTLRASAHEAVLRIKKNQPVDVSSLKKASKELQSLLPKQSVGLRFDPL